MATMRAIYQGQEYEQPSLLAYVAPPPRPAPALTLIVSPPPPREREPISAEQVWVDWQLNTTKLLMFCDRDSGEVIVMAGTLLKQFFSAGRKTKTMYTIEMLDEPHHFTVNKHEQYTIEPGKAIRITYHCAGLKGQAVFMDRAGLTGKRSDKLLYSESKKSIFI